MFKLKVEKRDLKESLDVLRKSGQMPAIFYGPKDPSTPIKMSLVDFKKAWKTDMIEENPKEIPVVNNSLVLTVGHNAIETYKISVNL